MLTKQQLEEIAERADKATEGSWQTARLGDSLAIMASAGNGAVCFDVPYHKRKDATFIANAREDVPKLLDHIAEQEAEIERLKNTMLDAVGYVMGDRYTNRGVK